MMTLLATLVLPQAVALPSSSPLGAVEHPPRYTLTEVVTPETQERCSDLSEDGTVVGVAFSISWVVDSKAFLWREDTVTMLPNPPGATRLLVSGVDSTGRIYGNYQTTIDSQIFWQGVSWQAGALVDLETPFQNVTAWPFVSPSGNWIGVNTLPFDHGTPGWKNEFGWVDEPDFGAHTGDTFLPWLQHAGVFRGTGTVAGGFSTYLYDVTDAGQAVGRVFYGAWNQMHAVRWDEEQGMILLGRSGRHSSAATAINAHGEIVGWVEKSGHGDANTDMRFRPFIWRSGVWMEIPVPTALGHARALDINVHSVVVGNYAIGAGAGTNQFKTDGAWIYVDGRYHDLNDLIPASSGWTLTNAIRINDAGQILAAEFTGPDFLDSRWAVLTPR